MVPELKAGTKMLLSKDTLLRSRVLGRGRAF